MQVRAAGQPDFGVARISRLKEDGSGVGVIRLVQLGLDTCAIVVEKDGVARNGQAVRFISAGVNAELCGSTGGPSCAVMVQCHAIFDHPDSPTIARR